MIKDEERRRVAAELRGWEFYYPENLDKYLCDVFGIPANANMFFAPDVANPEDAFIPNVLANYIEPSCDRDALLALADEIEDNDVTYCVSTQYVLDSYARRIREALGARR